MFNEVFKSSKVLVTGHTGFKGSWVVTWLNQLGANVVGVSDGVPTTPANFTAANLEAVCESHICDVRDGEALSELISKAKPDFVFHLAAQALVKDSYADPVGTLTTNAVGSANVLAAVSKLENDCAVVMVTSDKCYENVETFYGYREDDRLGGADPYSASKAAAEIFISSYVRSFIPAGGSLRVLTARAGNVIGGGDWAANRLVPDLVRSWQGSETVEIRSPRSTRPWQHVLEPLSGYLQLAAELSVNATLHGESYNLGPSAESVIPVGQLVETLAPRFDGLKVKISEGSGDFHEAGLLKLSCDKVLSKIGWKPTLSFAETMDFTAGWYVDFYQDIDAHELTNSHIKNYCDLASARSIAWTQQ